MSANAFTYTTDGVFYEGQAGTLIATALRIPATSGGGPYTFPSGTYDLKYSKDNQTPPYNYITSVTIGTEQETITFNIKAEEMHPHGTWYLVLTAGVFLTLYNYQGPLTISEAPAAVMCFKKDTKILTFNDEKQQEKYVPIQELKIGTLIKTIHNYGEYKPIVKIKSLKINNGIYAERTKDQLYIANKQSFPQLTEDLIITGAHSILDKSRKTNACVNWFS